MSLRPPVPPCSPFSAPFSKSGRETWLRIRNLCQWKKKRPPLLALVLVCGMIVCSGSLISCRDRLPRSENVAVVSPEPETTLSPSMTPDATQSQAPDLDPFFHWDLGSMEEMLQSGARFDGNRSSNSRELDMDYSILNGTFTHTLRLKVGDVLNIDLKVDEGSLGAVIQQEDGTTIYQNENLETSQFTLEIAQSGTYQVTITGLNTKGSILIEA